jgi:hypothetical protein
LVSNSKSSTLSSVPSRNQHFQAMASLAATNVSTLPVVIQTRAERIAQFGIDCGNGLSWRGWEAGGDYQKVLYVRNVTTDVIKVKYKLPKSNFFYLEFPSVVTLSPGMTHSIPVNFRPVQEVCPLISVVLIYMCVCVFIARILGCD